MSDSRGKKGAIVDPRTVRFERVLPGPMERVWAHLTDPSLVSTWLAAKASIELRPGGHVELHMGHGGELPENIKDKIVDGDNVAPVVRGVVTRFEPGRALAFTWRDDNMAEGVPDSELSFELEPRGDDVLLVLTHRNVDPKYIPQVLAGWHTLLDTLASRIRSEEPTNFFARFEEALSQYTPKSAP
jgi:uncharacterized protein YndB with AHSA1/START domain